MNIRGRVDRLGQWWARLSTAWRINVLLYGVAGVFLVALVAQLPSGGGNDSRRLEVVSPAQNQSSTTLPATTTSQLPTATAVTPSTLAAPSSGGVTPPAPGPTTPKAPGAAKPPVKFNPAPESTTTVAPSCHNSTDPRCGPFRWDPSPGGNAGLAIAIDTGATPPQAGQEVTFTVDVTDADHVVSDNCAEADYGDGTPIERRPCRPAPCPDARGAWTPPARQGDHKTFIFKHTYGTAGDRNAKFTFHTDRDRCPDPYGNAATGIKVFTVVAPPPLQLHIA